MKKKIGEVSATRDGVGRLVSQNEHGIVRHCFHFHLSYLVLGKWSEPLIAVLSH